MREHEQAVLCDPAAVEVWDHSGKLYEVNSYYSLPDDAWQYELTGAPGTGSYLAIVIPDAAPEHGPFTPKHKTVKLGIAPACQGRLACEDVNAESGPVALAVHPQALVGVTRQRSLDRARADA
jgi:hypothetical protein